MGSDAGAAAATRTANFGPFLSLSLFYRPFGIRRGEKLSRISMGFETLGSSASSFETARGSKGVAFPRSRIFCFRFLVDRSELSMDFSGGFSDATRRARIAEPSSRNVGAAEASTSYKLGPNLNDLYVDEEEEEEEEDECEILDCVGKKKQTTRMKGCGLRVFSTKVCTKIRAKGRTTFNEVADEIISELRCSSRFLESKPEFDVKNIRRRVYDAFNVLMSINVIAKDKKEYIWIGFPAMKADEMNKLQEVRACMIQRVHAKANLLKELHEHYADLQNLIFRNRRRRRNPGGSSEAISLPFLLVRADPHATIEIEISDDTKLVDFDFGSTPFKLLNDAALLRAMRAPQTVEATPGSAPAAASSTLLNTDQWSDLLKPVSFTWNSERFSC